MLSIIRRHFWPLAILQLTFGLYFVLLFARLLFFDNGALYVGHEHAWSDWPLHIAISNIFAHQPPEQWFTHHPMYASGGLRYTFLTNFISGMLIRLGLPLTLAFSVPSLIFSVLLIGGIYALFFLLLKNKFKALLVVAFFFLSSGLGFFVFLGKLIETPSWEAFFYPELMYSRAKEFGWHSGNIIAGFLVPQRSSLLGFTLGVWVLTLFIYGRYFVKNLIRSRLTLIIAGLLAGLMPIAHMHSFIVIAFVTGVMSIVTLINIDGLQNIKSIRIKHLHLRDISWLYYAIPATILSVFLYYCFFYSGSELKGYIRFYPFWEAKGSVVSWLWMWFKLWGVVLPLAFFGFYIIRRETLPIKAFYYCFLIIFILSNFFLLQPVAWDNSKIFFWCYLAFIGLAIQTLSKIWIRAESRNFIARFDVLLLSFVICFTGVLELIRLQRIDKNRFHIISKNEIVLAENIRQNTDNNSIFLTASYVHQFIMVWTGRPILLGFKGWMSNFGFDYAQRESDIAHMYQGLENTEFLLKKYNVSYVVFGEGEVNEYKANERYYRKNYPLAFNDAGKRIYDVRVINKLN